MFNKKTLKFYSPIYWPFWFVIGILWLLVQLPYKVQLKLGKYLGLLLLIPNSKFKRTTKTNIDLCFSELSDKERKELVRKNFISVGIAVFETGLAWFGSDRRLRRLVNIEGLDYWKKAQTEGHGVILLGAHFLTLELVGRLFALNCDFTIVYRAHKKPFINFLISRFLKDHYSNVIERNNVRGIVKELKEGKMVWYTPDIDAGFSQHLFIPFFNIKAATLTATVRLAELSNAKIIPCYFCRRDDGLGYNLFGLPPLDNFPIGNMEQDLIRINRVTEDSIRKCPDQYIWQYKRFRTRPKGERKVY